MIKSGPNFSICQDQVLRFGPDSHWETTKGLGLDWACLETPDDLDVVGPELEEIKLLSYGWLYLEIATTWILFDMGRSLEEDTQDLWGELGEAFKRGEEDVDQERERIWEEAMANLLE